MARLCGVCLWVCGPVCRCLWCEEVRHHTSQMAWSPQHIPPGGSLPEALRKYGRVDQLIAEHGHALAQMGHRVDSNIGVCCVCVLCVCVCMHPSPKVRKHLAECFSPETVESVVGGALHSTFTKLAYSTKKSQRQQLRCQIGVMRGNHQWPSMWDTVLWNSMPSCVYVFCEQYSFVQTTARSSTTNVSLQ